MKTVRSAAARPRSARSKSATDNGEAARARRPRGRPATALGALVVVLATALALPGGAGAAVTPTPPTWSRVDPHRPGDPPGVGVQCGARANLSGAYNPSRGQPNGAASVAMCLRYYHSPGGSYYYQGVLELKYHAYWSGASDVFGGQSMSVLGSTGISTGIANCPRLAWHDGDHVWCYSPTRVIRGAGQKLYGKAYVSDPSKQVHPLWSPVTTTSSSAPPSSKTYRSAINQGFGGVPRGAKRIVVNSGVKTRDNGVIVTKFFIPNPRAAAGLLAGDGRSWSTDPATARRSRVYLTWDPATGRVSATVSSSTLLLPRPLPPKHVDALKMERKGRCGDVKSTDLGTRRTNQFYIGRAGAGLTVCVSALNSITSRFPTILGRVGRLSVDAQLSIIPNPKSPTGYDVRFRGNGYPAIEMYRYPRASNGAGALFLRRIDPAGRTPLDPSGGLAADDKLSTWVCSGVTQRASAFVSRCTFDRATANPLRQGHHLDTRHGDRPG